MNVRLIVALVLSIVVLLVYQALFAPKAPEERAPEQPGVTEEARQRPAETPSAERRVPEQPEQEERREKISQGRPAARGEEAPKAGVRYDDVVVETPLYRAVFTTYGARLKSWELKNYKDKVKMTALGRLVQGLVGQILGKREDADSPPQPVDIVNTRELRELPLGIGFTGQGMGYDEGIPYRPSVQGLELREGEEDQELIFSWSGPSGLEIERHYVFSGASYRMDTVTVIRNAEQGRLIEGSVELTWKGMVGEKTGYYGFYGPVYYRDGSLEKVKPKKLKSEARIIEDPEWSGLNQDYFIALIYPVQGRHRLVLSSAGENQVTNELFTQIEVQPGEDESVGYRLFLGPKDRKLLANVGEKAKEAVSYGWFSVLAIPILRILSFTHGFTGNYGVDIIILSVFLKILFTPLTHKSQQSMKEMQKLQPEIKRLQQKYKNNRQQLNREMMELYKRRKVNPFSGCLPMLIQLPVFFALYRGLLSAIELRHSPFILWIRDLSDKDPTYISPLLMGASMFIQQKMTAVPSADATQAKMMTLMPIFFTFIFLNFPSGLVLYWLVTNILTIAHQAYINKR
jgi:YidC/Oxa1 family membrane protein insertase